MTDLSKTIPSPKTPWVDPDGIPIKVVYNWLSDVAAANFTVIVGAGIVVWTGTTPIARSVVATTNKISVTNGSGVAGNIGIDVNQTNLSIATTQLTGIIQATNFPALTGDVVNSSGSLATRVAQVTDTSGNELLKFGSTALAINEITITNAGIGSGPIIGATGDDTSISINFRPKGISGYSAFIDNTGTAMFNFVPNPAGAGGSSVSFFPGRTAGGQNPEFYVSGAAVNQGISFRGVGDWFHAFHATTAASAKVKLYAKNDESNGVKLAAADTMAATYNFTYPAALGGGTNDILVDTTGGGIMGYKTKTQLTIASSGANADITSLTGLTGIIKAPTAISDSSSNVNLSFTYQTSPVGNLAISNAASGSYPFFNCQGSASSLNLGLFPKNADVVVADVSNTIAAGVKFYNAASTHFTTLKVATLAATDYTITLPSADGTNGQHLVTNASGVLSYSSNILGNAVTATTATNATNTAITDDTSTNATMYPTWVTTTTGNLPQKISSTKLTFNPNSGTLTTTTFSGALSGNATTSTNTTGNAATVTTNANLTGPITSSGNATSIASQTGTGTKFVVDTSPTLITPNLGTPTAGVISACTSTSMVMVTPLLGTPTSGVLTNCTGYTDANLSTSDITTNNATTSKHGFLLKLNNSATQYMNGQGAWTTPAGSSTGTLIGIQVFTATGTYTPTTGMVTYIAEAVGGGGGSGGVAGVVARGGASGGGGGGGYLRIKGTASDIGASKAVTIGAGGTGGASGANNGGNGAATTLGATLWSAGGGALGTGVTASAANAINLGGAGGTNTVTTGTTLMNIPGNRGGPGIELVTTGTNGAGGDSMLGKAPGSSIVIGASDNNGVAGTSYGTGASGAASSNGTSYAGAAGGIGYMIIYEYN